MLEVGHRWTPTDALRALVPLGQALDAMAEQGFTPIELSPDHLVFNSGSICLVGIGRHVYLPAEHRMPGVQGMSLPSALLLGDDLPISSGATAQSTVQWRDVQQRALLRLAAWMACGLAPAAWGRVRDQRDLAEYLTGFAGFTQVPSIRPGRLAESLEKAAALEEAAATRKRITQTKAILVYDDTCSAAAPQNWYAWAKALEGRQVEGYVTYVDESRLTATVEAGSGQKWDIRLSRVETPRRRTSGRRLGTSADWTCAPTTGSASGSPSSYDMSGSTTKARSGGRSQPPRSSVVRESGPRPLTEEGNSG